MKTEAEIKEEIDYLNSCITRVKSNKYRHSFAVDRLIAMREMLGWVLSGGDDDAKRG